jgi:hypothetical protein
VPIDQRQQGRQVFGRRALANHDVHAGLQFFARLFQPRALVVAGYARGDIGVQVDARQPRGVTVDRFARAFGQGDFAQDLGIGAQHTGIVHHFRQPQDAFLFHEGPQVVGRQPGARGFHSGGRHAGGEHEKDVDRLALACGEHVPDSFDAQHVGDLVRVGDHGGGAARCNRAGEPGDSGHGTLDVDVGVDESRGHDAAVEGDGLAGPVGADADDGPILDGDVARHGLTGKNVEDAAAFEQQIGLRFAARAADGLGVDHGWLSAVPMVRARALTRSMIGPRSRCSGCLSLTSRRPSTTTVVTSLPLAA